MYLDHKRFSFLGGTGCHFKLVLLALIISKERWHMMEH